MHVDIDLDKSVTIPEWELNENYSCLDVSTIPLSNVINSDLRLSKGLSNSETVTRGAGDCVENSADLKVSVWGLVYNIWLQLRKHDCTVERGQMGGLHWKYRANEEHCSTNPDQKTIADAIISMIRKLGGNWGCNNHCILMSHGGTLHGTLIVGTSSAAWMSSCGGVFKGNWDMDSGSLEWPISSYSQSA